MSQPKRTPNALIHETSPYLLQHAYNPVNWYPWGKEAFAQAETEERPVFLSVGYSTCHWCHVMERESFEDDEVARLLNTHFVSIKVDKEERPDIDAVYMQVCQALTGSGGWPMTILMTPEQKPFYAGTYFPKHRRYGHMGLLELLESVIRIWREDREKLYQSGAQIAEAVNKSTDHAQHGQKADNRAVEGAVQLLAQTFDAQWGGFGQAPKFPTPHNILFLLRYHNITGDENALHMAETTLEQMARGGIFDHIGGGFSRYSTDEYWLVPHFEKMLYDNALLLMAYLEAWQATGKPLYRQVATKTLGYIFREMTAPGGGFYSAQDADVDGEEGKFYTLTPEEVKTAVGQEAGEEFCAHFAITPTGNFEDKSIPNLLEAESLDPIPRLEALLPALTEFRSARHALHKDDKILTAWNGLMIAACAKAGRVLDHKAALKAAQAAYSFLQTSLIDWDDRLKVSWRNGKATGTALLDDYAFLCWAQLELYASTFQPHYLKEATATMNMILARFSDDSGGFFLSPDDGEALLFRPKEQYDGAMPCGNSVAAYCLGQLAALTGEPRWQEATDRQLDFFAPVFARHPQTCTFALLALMQQIYPAKELICLVEGEENAQRLAVELGRHYHPQAAVLAKWEEASDALSATAPLTQDYSAQKCSLPAFYLCQNKSCNPPVHSLAEILPQLSADA